MSGVIGLAIGGLCLSQLISLWPTRAGLAERFPVETMAVLGYTLLMPLLCLVPTALFLYSAGPADLIVDTDRRTYRFRRGFPLLAPWREGTLDDITGVRRCNIGGRSGSSQILLDWKNVNPTFWTLGDGAVANRRPFQMATTSSSWTGETETEAKTLAQKMGVPYRTGEAPFDRDFKRGMGYILLIPILAFFLFAGLSPFLVAYSLKNQGQDTTGVVTALGNGKSHSARCTYRVAGHTFEKYGPVDDALEIGSPVTIRYLPAYPRTSTVGESQDGMSRSLPMLIGSGLLVMIVLWMEFKDRANRQSA